MVIVNWNTREHLRRCLNSVHAGLPPAEFEVFVVDNASSDGSGEMVRAEFPAVSLIQNHENRGFARANNQALLRSRGRWLVLLNPDTELQPETVSACISYLSKNPRAAVVGVELRNPDGSLQVGFFTLPVSFSQIAASLLHPTAYYTWWRQNYQADQPPRLVDWVSGSFMVVRREAAEIVGLFDERFFIFSEETEWCTRFRKAGWSVAYLSSTHIIHHHHKSTHQAPPELQAHALKGRQVLYWTHDPGPGAALVTLHAVGAGLLAITRGLVRLLRGRPLGLETLRLGYRILVFSLAAVFDRKPRVPHWDTGQPLSP